MKLGFKKIIFCRKIPKSPFLSNLYNKRIQSKLKVEETKLNFLIDQVKNKHSFVRNYSMFSKSMTKLPLIMKNNNHILNRDYSYNSYLYYNKKLSPEFQTINSKYFFTFSLPIKYIINNHVTIPRYTNILLIT